jgi:hypothetical protein
VTIGYYPRYCLGGFCIATEEAVSDVALQHKVVVEVTVDMELEACDSAFKAIHCAKVAAEAGVAAEKCVASCVAGSVSHGRVCHLDASRYTHLRYFICDFPYRIY